MRADETGSERERDRVVEGAEQKVEQVTCELWLAARCLLAAKHLRRDARQPTVERAARARAS